VRVSKEYWLATFIFNKDLEVQKKRIGLLKNNKTLYDKGF
jgi:hypothetical protein